MSNKFKYSESMSVYLSGRTSTSVLITNWIGTLSDTELSEFGDMIKTATRGKPNEDLARFLAAAVPRQDEEGREIKPTKKILERFLGVAYSTIVMERKERLQKNGKHVHNPYSKSACSCCSH